MLALFIPKALHNFWNVVIDILPDVAMTLLTFAGLGYLVPEILQKIESSRITRSVVAAVFVALGISAIVINHRERTAARREAMDVRTELGEARKEATDARQESNRQFHSLPQAIAAEVSKYLRYTAPSPLSAKTQNKGVIPAAPTGLIAVVDGQVGMLAHQLSQEVEQFLTEQGAPPVRNLGESDFDFVVRSNAWYANVMAKYNFQLKDRVANAVKILVDSNAIDARVATLAKTSENIAGIRALAEQLEEGAKRFGPPRTPQQ